MKANELIDVNVVRKFCRDWEKSMLTKRDKQKPLLGSIRILSSRDRLIRRYARLYNPHT